MGYGQKELLKMMYGQKEKETDQKHNEKYIDISDISDEDLPF